MSHSLKKSKKELAYVFLQLAEKEQRAISLNEFIEVTGYAFGTARTYFKGRWSRFLIPETDGRYTVIGVQKLTIQEFADSPQRHLSSASVAPPRRLVLSLSFVLGEWLDQQAIHQQCSIHDLIVRILEQHRLLQ